MRTAAFDVVYVNNGGDARAIVVSLILAIGTLVSSALTLDAKTLFHDSPHER